MVKNKMTLEEKVEEAIAKDVHYEVPANWINISFGSIMSIEGGTQPPKSQFLFEPTEGYIRLYQIRDFSSENFHTYVKNEKKLRIMSDEDIMIARYGASIGKIFRGRKGAYNVALAKLIYPKELYDVNFLYWFLKSDLFQNNLGDMSRTAVAGFNKNDLKNFIIPLPPLKEQERIVDKIESLFEKLDKAKELIEEARDNFEKRKSAILEKTFRGELTQSWRKKNVCGKGEIKKIGDIAQLISGQHIASSDYNNEGIGIGYLTGPSDFNEINPSITKWTDKPKVIAMNNDVLITVKGSGVGSVNILNEDNVCISRQLMAIRVEKVSHYYIYWYLKSYYNNLQSMATGTAIPGLSRGDILGLEIYCPTKEEEKEIVKVLNKLLEKESKIEELTSLEEQIELIKKSILAKAFRGQLGTNCEEDESALELLKEILGKE